MRSQFYCATLLILVALSTYLNIPLAPSGRLLVPSVTTVALIPLIWLAVRRNFAVRDKIFLLKLTWLLLLSIALSPGYNYISEKFLSLIQFCLALGVTFLTVRLMLHLRPEVLERSLLVLWLLIVVGSLLEVADVIRGLSDAFRVWAYEGIYTLYTSEDRDMRFVGLVRPRLFSTEPSHVTTIFIVSINAWLLVRLTLARLAVAIAASAVMFLLMGSPTYIASAIITLAIVLTDARTTVDSRVGMLLVGMLIGVFAVVHFGDSVIASLASRLDRIGDRTMTGQVSLSSENLRVVYPFLTLIDTWSRWPIFGVGVGGKELVMENSIFPHVDPRFAIGTSAVAELGIYLGLLGSVLFVWLVKNALTSMGVRRLTVMFLTGALIMQLQGGIESFRLWGFVALIWGALAAADTRAARSRRNVELVSARSLGRSMSSG